MNKLLLVVVFLASVPAGICQSVYYQLTMEVLGEDNRTSPASYMEIMINSQRQKADKDGRILYLPATGSKQLQVKAVDQREYLIVGANTIGLPADPSTEIVVTLRRPKDKEKGLAQVMAGLKQLNIDVDKIDSMRQTDRARYEGIMKIQDSILRVVTRDYNLKESDLRSELDKMLGRDKYYPSISFALEMYLNEAKDIRDVFKNMVSFTLENPASIRLFDSTIRVYNNAYNVLNANNNDFEKAVLDFWESEELAYGFRNLFDFAINNIHRAEILHLNTELNMKLNRYIHTNSRRERKTLKAEIMVVLNTVIPRLDNDLTVLENKTRTYLGKLDAKNLSFNH